MLASASRNGDGGAPLEALADLAARARSAAIAREASEAARRLAEGRFHVACVGQFKRGKSTLLNALIGEAVLPMGIVPVTSAITVLRHGRRRASVSFADGRAEEIAVESIARYVSQEQNPENRLEVRVVEVFVPSLLLAGGMCLVDTPGLGSVFQGNSAVTREYVPRIDAALVVIGADPPISGDEVALVERVASQVHHVMLVLNKADRLSEVERTEGARFATEVLSRRLRRPLGRVYQVSAAERLNTGAPTRDLGALQVALEALSRTAGADLVAQAGHRALERLGRALLGELEERRAALLRPIEASERRLEALARQLRDAEQALVDLGALLAAEEGRLTRAWVARHEAFIPAARQEARLALDERLTALAAGRTRIWEATLDAAIEVADQTARRFRDELVPVAEAAYRAAMRRFVELANGFLAGTASKAGWARPPRPIGEEASFLVRGNLRFTALRYGTTRLPWALFLDLVRTRAAVLRSARHRAQAHLARLVETNGSRVAFDLADRAGQGRSRLEREVRGRLGEVLEVARAALDEARRRRAEGEEAVQAELGRLDTLCSELEPLLAAPSHGGETP